MKRKNSLNRYLSVVTMALLCVLCLPAKADAQRVALKTNVISDALLSPNLGIEFRLAPQWSLDITGQLNAWTVGDERRWKHWLVQPEARYWFCEAISGHFLGAHLIGGQFNFGHLPLDFKFLGTDFSALKEFRYQGWMAGAGIAYGYSWILDKHWNLEAELGIGWIYTRYDKFKCADCGKKLEENRPHNYFGPTKAALNLVYSF